MGRVVGVKPLSELTLAELWQLFPIELSPHNPAWARWYAEAAARLNGLLGDGIVRISHIGSTSVPGLEAKPIVDLLLEVDPTCDRLALVKALENDQWLVMHRQDSPEWRVDLNQGYTAAGWADRVFHLHVVLAGDHDELYFRDWLLDHPATGAAYQALKRDLARRFRHDRDAYTQAKAAFIQSVTAQARLAYSGRYR